MQPREPDAQPELGGLVGRFAADPDDHALWHELARQLAPVIECVAANVASRRRLPNPDFFVAGAPNYILGQRSKSVPRICLWRSDRGTVEQWLWRVLDRAAGDELAREKPTFPPLEHETHARNTGVEWCLEEARVLAFLDSPFPPEDLHTLGQWSVAYRLELPCIGGLWVKFPPAAFAAMLREYEQARGIKLPRPFPPAGFLLADRPADRISRLAEPLGYEPDTLKHRWWRNQGMLWELSCMREFRPPD